MPDDILHGLARLLGFLAAIPVTLAIVAVLSYAENWYHTKIKPWG